MEWLTAVGALAGPVVGIADALTGTGTAKANAATAASNAQIAQYQAQAQQAHEDALRQEQQTKTIATYGLVAVALVVGGYLLVKAL